MKSRESACVLAGAGEHVLSRDRRSALVSGEAGWQRPGEVAGGFELLLMRRRVLRSGEAARALSGDEACLLLLGARRNLRRSGEA